MGIKDHKWGDGSLALFEATSEGLWLVVNDTDANINKSDAIAIAKHFGLIESAKTDTEIILNAVVELTKLRTMNSGVSHFAVDNFATDLLFRFTQVLKGD